MAGQQGLFSQPRGVVPSGTATVRPGETVLYEAEGDPRRAWNAECCQPICVIMMIPPFFVFLPFFGAILSCEAKQAKKRAQGRFVLSDQAIYCPGYCNLTRVPLEELANVTTVPKETCCCNGDEHTDLQITTQGNNTPVAWMPCVRDADTFKAEVFQARNRLLGIEGGAGAPNMNTSSAGAAVGLHQQPQPQAHAGGYEPRATDLPPAYPAGAAAAPGPSAPLPAAVRAPVAGGASLRLFVKDAASDASCILRVAAAAPVEEMVAAACKRMGLKLEPRACAFQLHGFPVSEASDLSNDDHLTLVH